ncbi:MAG: hypothetical protein HY716_03955 [Planctomycetes bacterium]|nr:hypothetical protein [Planctomycetota bacterium]
MDYWWKENKRFVIAASGGALALLLWVGWVVAPANADVAAMRLKREAEERALRVRLQAGVPTEEAIAAAERDRLRLLEDLRSIQADAEFPVEAAYRLSQGQTAVEWLARQRADLAKVLDHKCREKGFPRIPGMLGMPASFQDLPDAVAEEWLARLAIVKRVCFLAIEHLQKIELTEVVPSDYQDEPLVRRDRFLNRLTVHLKATGSADALLRFVHALQQKGSYLALDEFSAAADPGRGESVEATLRVGALILHSEAPPAAAGKRRY